MTNAGLSGSQPGAEGDPSNGGRRSPGAGTRLGHLKPKILTSQWPPPATASIPSQRPHFDLSRPSDWTAARRRPRVTPPCAPHKANDPERSSQAKESRYAQQSRFQSCVSPLHSYLLQNSGAFFSAVEDLWERTAQFANPVWASSCWR